MKSHAQCNATRLERSEPIRAFTFIEIIIVLALLTGILSLTVLANTDALQRLHVREERDMFVSVILTPLRDRALGNVHMLPHGVHIDTIARTYTLFEGTTFDRSDPNLRVIPFRNNHVEITPEDGNATIIFSPILGDVLTGQGAILFSQGTSALRVEINEAGRIDW